MSDLYIKVQSAGTQSKGLMPTQTGQTTSYASNDDGDLERGRLTNFDTIPYNNPFGKTQRFSDRLGGQNYADAIVIDWSTWDGGSSVLAYATSNNSSQIRTRTWADWMSNSAANPHHRRQIHYTHAVVSLLVVTAHIFYRHCYSTQAY